MNRSSNPSAVVTRRDRGRLTRSVQAAKPAPFTQIWVAEGEYTPKSNGDQTSTFSIPNRVLLYGGFEGDETDLDDRNNPLNNPTILNGDISSGTEGDIDNIITIDNIESTIIDGFIIQSAGGSASSPDGGGILINNSTAILRNLVFDGCAAGPTTTAGRGGAIAVLGDSSVQLEDAIIANCQAPTGGAIFSEAPIQILRTRFTNNTAQSTTGGAVALRGTGVSTIFHSRFEGNSTQNGPGGAVSAEFDQPEFSALLIEDSVFINNTGANGSFGGAVAFEGRGSNKVSRSRFLNNETPNAGGAIFVDLDSSADELVIESSFFSGNRSGFRGGAVYHAGAAELFLINSTITSNEADGLGAGVFTLSGDCYIANSILWDNNNTSTSGQPRQDQFSFSGGGAPRVISVDWCRVQGWSASPLAGVATNDNDPGLADPLGPDGTPGTEDDSALLAPGASAIDAGNNLWAITYTITDLNQQQRYIDDPGTPDTGADPSGLPLVDIGATEFQDTTLPCPGDTTNDNTVGLDDLLTVLSNFGASTTLGPPAGDLDFSGTVGLDDLLQVLGNFGGGCP